MTSASTLNARFAALGAALLMSLPATRDASAFTKTGIQTNGAECAAESSYDSASAWRTSLGYRNNQASAIAVHCPITPPSHDSYQPGFLTYSIHDVELFYSGAAPTSCYVIFRNDTGSIYYSPQMTSGTSASTGTTVMKLPGAFAVIVNSAQTVSEGIVCTLPGYSRILGTTAFHSVTDITSGT
jgi:hypothetical protein